MSTSATDDAARPPRIAWVLAGVCFALAALLWTGPDLAREDRFNGDAAHHVFWFYRYADPALFPDDLSIEYFASGSVAPPGYRALYATLAPLVDVLTAAEWMSVALLGLSVWLAFKLGATLGEGRDGGLKGLFCVAATLVVLPQSDLLPAMGFQRTFALPLTLLCLWALVARRYFWVGVAWLSAALFYPIIIAVLGLAACLVFLGDLIRERRMPPAWKANLVFGVAAIGIVLVASGTPESVGPSVSYEQALSMPEFGPGGRQVLFGTGWSGGIFRHHRTGLGWSPWAMLVMLAALGLTAALGYAKLIPRAVILLGGTGLALWLAARLTMFDLYLPNRHSRYALAALIIVALTTAAYTVLARASAHFGKRSARAARILPVLAAVAAPLAVAAALTPSAIADWQEPVDRDLERTYEFLGSLPKDTLVAAHPDLADYIPLRSRRSVLASTEGWIAFMQGYHARTTPRIEASLRAAYATGWDELTGPLEDYGVDVFVSAEHVFDKTSYHPPLDGLARELIERGRREGFVLRKPPEDRVLFRSGPYVVVSIAGSEP